MPCPKDWSRWLLLVEVDLSPESSSLRLASGKSGHCMITRAGNKPLQPTMAYGLLLVKRPSSAFTFMTLLRPYAKQALTHGK